MDGRLTLISARRLLTESNVLLALSGEQRRLKLAHELRTAGSFSRVSGRRWQHGQHCFQCRDLGARYPDTDRRKVEMSLAPNLRAQQQLLMRRPDRAVELRTGTHQSGPPALAL